MLPKTNRLQKQDFDNVREKGFVVNGNLFGLAIYKRNNSNPPRFGFIVSKKISSKAVERNRIKRILRQSLFSLLSKFKNGYDVVFLAKKAILEKSNFSDVADEIEKVGRKGKIL